MFEKKIKAAIILEILGRPKEHIIEVMKQIVESIGKEAGIKVTNKTVHEAVKYTEKDKDGKAIENPNQDELFTSFADIEFEAKNITDLLMICFKYMPANVELIEPEEFKFKNIDFNSLINEIIRRLHHYDAIAKSAIMNNQLLANQLKAMQTNQQSKDLSDIVEPKQEEKSENKPKKQEKAQKAKKKGKK